MKKNYFWMFCITLSFVLSFSLAGCGSDDPLPEPDPKPTPDPDPTPTVEYDGYACWFNLDSIAGDGDAFKTLMLDSMKVLCPQLKEIEPLKYGATLVYEKADTAKVSELKTQFRAFQVSLLEAIKAAHKPVVTSMITFHTASESKVGADWSFSFSGFSSSNTFGILIPALKSSVWSTEDNKGTNVESVEFKSWMSVKNNTKRFSGTVIVNGTDSYEALREGNGILLFDKDHTIKYGFGIPADGEQIALLRIGETFLEMEKAPVYIFSKSTKE